MLTTGEVAKLFQVSAQTVINWLDQGRMPFERIGKGPRRLTEETVVKYIKEIGISHSALDQTIFAKTLKRVLATDEKTNFPAALINADMIVIGWNDSAMDLTGRESANALGKPINELITRIEGTENNIETVLKGEWAGAAKELNVSLASSQDKFLELNLTVSKFYSQGDVAGYTLIFQKK